MRAYRRAWRYLFDTCTSREVDCSPGTSTTRPPTMVVKHELGYLVCVVTLSYLVKVGSSTEGLEQKQVKMDGDIILGGLFPMHEKGESGQLCGDIKEEKGIQRMEAMLYAIDLINADPLLLPNVSLGAHILDTCLRDTFALEQSLDFVKAHMNTLDVTDYRCINGLPPKYTPSKPVAGVIGAAASPVSIMVANILRLFKIPQISYASTAIELSDKTRFEYFSRVVPSDHYQAEAMVDVVKQFGWTYVSTLADADNYGEKGIGAFEKMATSSGICIARSLKIPREISEDTFREILKDLAALAHKARVVVMFVNEDNCRRLLQMAIKVGKAGDFYWLASDAWGAKVRPVEKQEWAAEGTVTILPTRNVIRGFDRYFTDLNPINNTRNPWFREFWQKHFQCTFNDTQAEVANMRLCTGSEKVEVAQEGVVPFVVDAVYAIAHALHDMMTKVCRSRLICPNMDPPSGHELLSYIRQAKFRGNEVLAAERRPYSQEGLVPFVVDAVYAMAHALQNMQQELCGETLTSCKRMYPPAGQDLLHYIRNVSFIGATGHEVKFTTEGDGMGRYTIYQFQKRPQGRSGYDYVIIGNWTNEQKASHRISLNISQTMWKNGSYALPLSRCSEPCKPGYRKSSRGCCWNCHKCTKDEILQDEYTCYECENGSRPNANKTECLPLPVEYLELSSAWAVVPVVFASLGIVITIFVFVVFMKYNRTPVIMASGRELCYVLLIGLVMCYAMTYVMVAKPSVISCTLLRLGLGLSLSICYAALFTKTNRISRIFNRGIKAMVKRPSYTSPKSQLVICFVLVAVQGMGAITWVGMDLPRTTHVYPDKHTVVLRCQTTNIAMVLSLLYNMILIIMCTVYAFKTRKIPENYNEAKYIAFTMYSTCIVWLAFIPIYFGTKNDYKIQITALCMCISISATVALGCLFAPKVYLVIFQPHKNVRQSVASALNPSSQQGRPLFGRQNSRFSSMNGDITSPTGLALLIAQGTVKAAERSSKAGSSDPKPSSKVDFEPIKDLDSSGPDTSEPEPETNV